MLDQQATGSVIRFFDTAQGRPVGEPFSHTLEIKEVALSQVGGRGVTTDRWRSSWAVSASSLPPFSPIPLRLTPVLNAYPP